MYDGKKDTHVGGVRCKGAFLNCRLLDGAGDRVDHGFHNGAEGAEGGAEGAEGGGEGAEGGGAEGSEGGGAD